MAMKYYRYFISHIIYSPWLTILAYFCLSHPGLTFAVLSLSIYMYICIYIMYKYIYIYISPGLISLVNGMFFLPFGWWIFGGQKNHGDSSSFGALRWGLCQKYDQGTLDCWQAAWGSWRLKLEDFNRDQQGDFSWLGWVLCECFPPNWGNFPIDRSFSHSNLYWQGFPSKPCLITAGYFFHPEVEAHFHIFSQ